jgi:site-specific recombinase XerD
MSALAPVLQAFFTDRLVRERHASPQTVAAYRDTWRLLLGFGAKRIGKPPSALDLEDLGVPLICAYLDHLEHDRGNSVRTRNARLAAIHSLFRYAAPRHPEHAATIARVLAILPKRFERALVAFLTVAEVEALLAAPDRTSWTGRRDHALLLVAVQTGLRISELIGLRRGDVHLGAGAHVACHGKGRKDRVTPLTVPTTKVLRAWFTELDPGSTVSVFSTRTGTPLSRDAIERRIALHVATAATHCPTLVNKKITAHVLRHTAAMRLLEAGIHPTVIALWLGHEHVDTTAIYLHAHLGIKEAALARTQMPDAKPLRYRPPDALLTFLESL